MAQSVLYLQLQEGIPTLADTPSVILNSISGPDLSGRRGSHQLKGGCKICTRSRQIQGQLAWTVTMMVLAGPKSATLQQDQLVDHNKYI